MQINCWCNISYIFSLKLSFTVIRNSNYDDATVLMFQLLRDPLCWLTTWPTPLKNHGFHEEHIRSKASRVQSFPSQFRPLCHSMPMHSAEKMVLFWYLKSLLGIICKNSTFSSVSSQQSTVVTKQQHCELLKYYCQCSTMCTRLMVHLHSKTNKCQEVYGVFST